jgi:hypothetical protein
MVTQLAPHNYGPRRTRSRAAGRARHGPRPRSPRAKTILSRKVPATKRNWLLLFALFKKRDATQADPRRNLSSQRLVPAAPTLTGATSADKGRLRRRPGTCSDKTKKPTAIYGSSDDVGWPWEIGTRTSARCSGERGFTPAARPYRQAKALTGLTRWRPLARRVPGVTWPHTCSEVGGAPSVACRVSTPPVRVQTWLRQAPNKGGQGGSTGTKIIGTTTKEGLTPKHALLRRLDDRRRPKAPKWWPWCTRLRLGAARHKAGSLSYPQERVMEEEIAVLLLFEKGQWRGDRFTCTRQRKDSATTLASKEGDPSAR